MKPMGAILDLDRYPLDRPDGAAWRALAARRKAELAANGMFNLEGFVRPRALRRAVRELTPLVASASFHQSREHNIYFLPEVPGAPADHPALATSFTSNRVVCDDRMAHTTIHAIYEWTPLADFLARVMDKPRLHLMADPLARANVMAYRAGEGLGWHFDRSEFTVTLLLQAPEKGGALRYRADLRTDDDPNLDGVARLLAGEDPETTTFVPTPGTLNVFKGRNTAHRVTPVGGDRDRLIAVFSYYDRPDVAFGAEERLGFYGRAS